MTSLAGIRSIQAVAMVSSHVMGWIIIAVIEAIREAKSVLPTALLSPLIPTPTMVINAINMAVNNIRFAYFP